MMRNGETQPNFGKLAHAVVVILTTFFGGIVGAPVDRVVDEYSQWNAVDSHLEEKTVVDSEGFAARRSMKLSYCKRGRPAQQRWDVASSRDADEPMRHDRLSDAAPHTAFGAGSMALSSLGHNASIPQLDT